SPSNQTRPSLLFRMRAPRDTKAWDDFALVYGPLVYGHARRRGLSHEDAEDVAQKVFARVSAAIQGFEYEREKGRFRDWLGLIVRNEVFRHWKKEENHAQVVAATIGQSTSWRAKPWIPSGRRITTRTS